MEIPALRTERKLKEEWNQIGPFNRHIEEYSKTINSLVLRLKQVGRVATELEELAHEEEKMLISLGYQVISIRFLMTGIADHFGLLFSVLAKYTEKIPAETVLMLQAGLDIILKRCEKSEDEVIKQQEKLSGLLKTYIDSTTKYSEATDGATWHKSNANSAWKVGLGFVGAGLVGGAVTFFTLGLGLPFVIAGSALTGGAITSSVSHAVSNDQEKKEIVFSEVRDLVKDKRDLYQELYKKTAMIINSVKLLCGAEQDAMSYLSIGSKIAVESSLNQSTEHIKALLKCTAEFLLVLEKRKLITISDTLSKELQFNPMKSNHETLLSDIKPHEK
jgi:prefoldin subunit 5